MTFEDFRSGLFVREKVLSCLLEILDGQALEIMNGFFDSLGALFHSFEGFSL